MEGKESTHTPPSGIEVDKEGRILINAPELARALSRAEPSGVRSGVTNNCPVINNVAGCGWPPLV